MGWISLFVLAFSAFAAPKTVGPEKLLTKHAIEAIRYIDGDGRVAYVRKRPGVLGIVSSFRSEEFVTDTPQSDFVVVASPMKRKVIVEIIKNQHTVFNIMRSNKLMMFNWGETKGKEVGNGMSARLHMSDEWLTYYRAEKRSIVVRNLITEKEYEIRLGAKTNYYFIPEIVMVASDLVVYTEINDQNLGAVISYNLLTKKSEVIYKSTQTATKMELCQAQNYLAIGEFPYDGVNRGSKIMQLPVLSTFNLGGFSTLYESSEQDVGNMVCVDDGIYFIKTTNQNTDLGIKTTDAVKLTLKNSQIIQKTNIGTVTQLLNMDGRVLLPHRDAFYVLEGEYNLSSETLKSPPLKEERP
ncbi:MAG: hypothetical protein ACJ76H_04770 [Bacteriovoracaceae bacterium]